MAGGLENIEIDELIKLSLDDRQIDLHTAMPAKVTAYNASTQTVDCIPQLYRWLPTGQSNETVTEPLPALSDVPVCFPRSGQYYITFPISAGDFVMLVFSERSLMAWRTRGDAGDPGDLTMHGLDGAIAIPGVFPDSGALPSVDPSSVSIGKVGGSPDFVALATKVKAWFDAFNAAVSGWTPVPMDGGAALKAALATLISGTPSTNVAANDVKAT